MMQYGTAERNAALDVIETTIGVSPTLELRSGLPPANAAAADSGSVLASMTLPADWMAAAVSGTKALAGTWEDPTADAGGEIGHFRLQKSGTCRWQGIVSSPWQATELVPVGAHRHNGGNIYRCTTSGTTAGAGGPTGTGTGIADGSAIWAFVQTGTDMTLDNAAVAAGQKITITSGSWSIGGA